MIRVILVAFVLYFISACHQANMGKEEKLFIDLDTSQDGNLSQLVQQIEYVLLEIPDSVPLVRVWKFSFWSGKIIVSDREKNNILIFDAKGEFEKIIESKGAGPKEFQIMEDYHVFNDHIYVLDGSLKKILKFDFEGEVVEETKIEFHPYNFYTNDSGFLYYFANNPNYEFYSVISEKEGEVHGVKTINKDFEGLKYASVYGFQFDSYNRNVLLKLDTSYEVVFFDEDLTKNNEVRFDFGRYNFPDEKRKEFFMSHERYSYLIENEMIENIFSFIPLKNLYLMIVNQVGKKAKIIVMDKDFDNLKVYSEIANDIDGFQSDFSPITQNEGNLIQIKASRNFYNEYLKNFGGKAIDPDLINDPKSIHYLFKRSKEKLKGDHYVVIKNIIKD